MKSRKPLLVDSIKKIIADYHQSKDWKRKRDKTSAPIIEKLEKEIVSKLSETDTYPDDSSLFKLITFVMEEKPESGKESEKTFNALRDMIEEGGAKLKQYHHLK